MLLDHRLRASFVGWIPYFLYLGLFVASYNHCFFWDTIQLSALHAQFYSGSNFSSLLLPDLIDSGHPPLMGLSLAFLWKIFGVKLWVGHLYIYLWTIVLVYQTQKTVLLFFERGIQATVVGIALLADATLLSQSILVSPDIILMTSFVAGIRYVLQNNTVKLMLFLLPLSLISTRGMVAVFALFVFNLFICKDQFKDNFFKTGARLIYPYVLPVMLAVSFLGYHYWVKGWVTYHSQSPWVDCFQLVYSLEGLAKNAFFLLWRFLDFGRFIIWLGLGILTYLFIRKKLTIGWLSHREKGLIVLLLAFIPFMVYSSLFHAMLTQHRYFLPHYFIISLLFFVLLERVVTSKKFYRIAIIVIVALFSGNFIVYPDKISTGWDSTLAHYPFYELRSVMFDYLEDHHIPDSQVSFSSWIGGDRESVDLIYGKGKIRDIDSRNIDTDYAVFSNISNASDDVIAELSDRSRWSVVQKFEKGRVKIILLKRNGRK